MDHHRLSLPSTGLALVRAAHPGPSVAVSVVAGLLAVAAGVSAGPSVLVVAAVLTGQLSVGWCNDLVDRDRDALSARPDKPLVTGVLSATTVRVACTLALASCTALSLACGWWPGLLHLALVGFAWSYNLVLKATVWSWLPYAVAFGGLPVFVASVDGGRAFAWWVPTAGGLLGIGAHLVNAVPDLADDAATGIRGLPHRLGARGSMALATTLLVTASAVVAIAPPTRSRPTAWVGLAATLVLAGVALTGRGRTPFRAAIAIALVDVVLLAWAL